MILGIFPAQYFDSQGRSLNCHIHNRVFGMLASNFASDLQKTLSVSLSTKVSAGTDASAKLLKDQNSVNQVGVVAENKDTVKNREAFIQLMEKVAELYLCNMFLGITEHSNVLRLMDVLFFQNFPLLIKMGLKLLAKVQPKIVKHAKAVIALLAKDKQKVDVEAMKKVAESCFPLFQTQITTADFNLMLKGALEDAKMQTLIVSKSNEFIQLA